MVGQHGLDLAIGIIESHFGDIVAKVCACLLRRGTLSLQEIVRSTGLSQSQVKNCLLVLIQHNCVQAFSIPKTAAFGSVPKAVTQYMGLFDNILHRMRFSKFLLAVKEDVGATAGSAWCEYILEGLLQHGRLTFEQLVVRAASKRAEGSTKIRDIVCQNFDKLVQAQYVERCPRPEPFLSPNSEHDTASTRRRGAKSTKETLTLEQQALTAAALLDAERFSGVADTIDGSMLEAKATVGEKRKHKVLEIDKETEAAIIENEVIWRANFEKLVQCLKKKVCVANVRARLNLDAAVVLEAMIESSNGQKENSVTSSLDSILERLRGKEGGRSMTMQHVRTFLEELGCQSRIKEGTTLYTLDLKHIVDICRNDEVEALVLNRYGKDATDPKKGSGKDAHRIFRLLARNEAPVETDRISDITFVDKKDAQRILYMLWMDNFLQMEKMVSHPGQPQLFLWKVNKNSVWENVLNDIYHAAINLKQRIAYNVEQQHEIEQQLTNDTQKAKLRLLQKTRVILETSLLKLDDVLLLFHDF